MKLSGPILEYLATPLLMELRLHLFCFALRFEFKLLKTPIYNRI